MVHFLKFLLTYKFKNSKPAQNNSGFTLIELLVGLALSFLVIVPLLGFMVNVMQNDRQEQAKATSEQEIQSALDYIARDLEQAVYIYDGEGLTELSNRNQLPIPDADSTPVLVFWKRQLVENILPTGDGNNKDDAFVYALVTYYIKKSNTATCATSPWSCTAQITRLQLRDAVKIKRGDQEIELDPADPGFARFDPTAGTTLTAAMNAWKNSGSFDPDKTPVVLIDYIDQTTPAAGQTFCPTTKQQVPPQPVASGLYACVDASLGTAKVFMRGNALARLKPKTKAPVRPNTGNEITDRASFFPQASIQIKGRGLFTINQTQ